jgi:hypothetical protein
MSPQKPRPASQLGADYLVEGSVLQSGDQLRVNLELVRARDDVSLWSGRFDRKLTDILTIQDEISRGIVSGLRLKLGPRRSRYETNLEAFELYLRGRQVMESFPTRGRPVASVAIQYFEQAIAKDEHYALTYAGMADALIAIDLNMGRAAPLNPLPRAKAAAARAVELDPMLSESQSALAAIRAREYAWQEAEQGFRRDRAEPEQCPGAPAVGIPADRRIRARRRGPQRGARRCGIGSALAIRQHGTRPRTRAGRPLRGGGGAAAESDWSRRSPERQPQCGGRPPGPLPCVYPGARAMSHRPLTSAGGRMPVQFYTHYAGERQGALPSSATFSQVRTVRPSLGTPAFARLHWLASFGWPSHRASYNASGTISS